jgi:hypothetical protein
MQLLEKIRDPVHKWGQETAARVKRERLSGYPLKKRTGRLFNSIKSRKPSKPRRRLRIGVESAGGLEHSAIHEWGKKGKRAFLSPIFEKQQPALIRDLDREIPKVLRFEK